MPSDLLESMRRNPAGDWQIRMLKNFALNMVCYFDSAKDRTHKQSIQRPEKY